MELRRKKGKDLSETPKEEEVTVMKRKDKEKKHLENGASAGDGGQTCVTGNVQERRSSTMVQHREVRDLQLDQKEDAVVCGKRK